MVSLLRALSRKAELESFRSPLRSVTPFQSVTALPRLHCPDLNQSGQRIESGYIGSDSPVNFLSPPPTQGMRGGRTVIDPL